MGLRHAPARHSADHGAGPRGAAGLGLLGLGALAFALPLPAPVLGYWRHVYPSVQAVLSRLSARLPAPALDVLVMAVALGLLWCFWVGRRPFRFARTTRRVLVATSAGWLLFLALWGWHYQVPTLEARLAIRDDELSATRGEAFARATVARINATHAEAHARDWPGRAELPALLGPYLSRALTDVGVDWTPVLPAPRRSMLDWYFRSAGIDGMTNPFGLEVVLNSRVLPMELPALAAHEYAHLAGFADESDASVVAWLACQEGSAALQYSSGLAVLPHLVTGLSSDVRRRVLDGLGPGPRRDLQAIAVRLSEQRPWIHAFAWQTYDSFLKANRVAEGVARYDAVARVLIGVADPATGRLRRRPSPWPLPGR